MSISVGEKIPEANLMVIGENGPEYISLLKEISGTNAVIFGVPGAFTPTCNNSHLPSFVNNLPALKEKGVKKVICISVNDPFVLRAWEKSMKIDRDSIMLLGDPRGEFIAKIGMEFSAEGAGLLNRSKRFTILSVNGVVKTVEVESNPGVCDTTSAETLMSKL